MTLRDERPYAIDISLIDAWLFAIVAAMPLRYAIYVGCTLRVTMKRLNIIHVVAPVRQQYVIEGHTRYFLSILPLLLMLSLLPLRRC